MARKVQTNPELMNVIKKYANRKFYSYADSMYLTYDKMAKMVLERPNLVFVDAQGNNITDKMLLEIAASEITKNGIVDPIGLIRASRGYKKLQEFNNDGTAVIN